MLMSLHIKYFYKEEEEESIVVPGESGNSGQEHLRSIAGDVVEEVRRRRMIRIQSTEDGENMRRVSGEISAVNHHRFLDRGSRDSPGE